MRKFAAFYNGSVRRERSGYVKPVYDDGTWTVIYQDEHEEEWYVEVPDAGSQESAVRLADALNTQARSEHDAG